MKAGSSTSYPRSRTLVHPGPFNPVRIQSRNAASARHVRLLLQPGLSLFDALVQPLAAIGIENASTTILGGMFECMQYCMAQPDPTAKALVYYTAPVESGPAWMVFGNATIGKGIKGEPIVHCHAAIRTEAGLMKGGHIITQECIVGPAPIPVLVTSLEGFELRIAFDPETNIALIKPRDRSPKGESS